MAANTYTQTVLGSGLQTSTAAAVTALQALIASIATYQGGLVTILDQSMDVVYGGASPAIGYNNWAWVAYYSAS